MHKRYRKDYDGIASPGVFHTLVPRDQHLHRISWTSIQLGERKELSLHARVFRMIDEINPNTPALALTARGTSGVSNVDTSDYVHTQLRMNILLSHEKSAIDVPT